MISRIIASCGRDGMQAVAGIPFAQQGRKTDDEGNYPNEGHYCFGSTGCHDAAILDWPRDGHISVHANGAQVQNGRGRNPDIGDEPAAAPEFAEHPHVKDLVGPRVRWVWFGSVWFGSS